MRNNRLETLPNSMAKLSGSLKKLYLHNNMLRHVPNCIYGLTRLETLMLHDNKITALPKTFTDMTDLVVLTLGNNPLDKPLEKYLVDGFATPKALHALKGKDVLDTSSGRSTPTSPTILRVERARRGTLVPLRAVLFSVC